MPQDTSQNYYYPDGTRGIPNETIESEAYNNFLDDLKINDLNWPRPIHRGGTGATTVDQALFNLSSEKAAQLVTNYDSHVWIPGSFYSASSATGAPVDGHAFAGICYINEPLAHPPTNANVTVSARDMTSGKVYVRMKTAGVWGSVWIEQAGSITEITDYVDAMVDTDAGARRNRVVNGAMQISQENGNTPGTAMAYYPADQWAMIVQADGPPVGTLTAQRIQSITPNGSLDRLRVTVTVAAPTLAINDILAIEQNIEGSSVADFRYGTASAKQAILRFGWRSPAGTYSISLRSSSGLRSYVANFTISASQANTDTEQVFVIPGDTTGAWLTTNGKGITIVFAVAAGLSYVHEVGWAAGPGLITSSNTNGMATTGNVFELFDVGFYLDLGEIGIAMPWEMPDPMQQLLLCKRYFYPFISWMHNQLAGAAGTAQVMVRHPVTMRASPTSVTLSATYGGGASAITHTGGTPEFFQFNYTVSGAGTATVIYSGNVKARM